MSLFDDPTLKNQAAATVRAGLYSLGTYLVAHGVITSTQNESMVAYLTPLFVGGGMWLAGYLWSLWQKKHANLKIDAALALPKDTPRAVLEQKVDKQS